MQYCGELILFTLWTLLSTLSDIWKCHSNPELYHDWQHVVECTIQQSVHSITPYSQSQHRVLQTWLAVSYSQRLDNKWFTKPKAWDYMYKLPGSSPVLLAEPRSCAPSAQPHQWSLATNEKKKKPHIKFKMVRNNIFMHNNTARWYSLKLSVSARSLKIAIWTWM